MDALFSQDFRSRERSVPLRRGGVIRKRRSAWDADAGDAIELQIVDVVVKQDVVVIVVLRSLRWDLPNWLAGPRLAAVGAPELVVVLDPADGA